MNANRFIAALCLVTALSAWGAEETYEQMAKKTNPAKAEEVFKLATWCRDHQMANRAQELYLKTVKIDPEYAPARAALGQVKVDSRWVSASEARKIESVKAAAATPVVTDEPPTKVGPGPKPSEVDWPLTLPVDPDREDTFIDSYIEKLPRLKNDSNEMDTAVATMLLASNRDKALPRLCKALQKDDFNDLYGGAEFVLGLVRESALTQARVVFPFVVVASSRITDPEDLQAFIIAATAMRDKRVIPRIIELMSNTNREVAQSAKECAAMITALPEQGLTSAKVTSWWSRNGKSDDRDIFRAQLNLQQPDIALKAATALVIYKDKQAVDTLIALMRLEDPKIAAKAHEQIIIITNRDWAYVATDPMPNKLQRVEVLAKWWKENREDFAFNLDPRITKDHAVIASEISEPNQNLELINTLAATDMKLVSQAKNTLLAGGPAAAKDLIGGLSSANPIIARQCHEILVRISGKTDIAFNPRAPLDQRQPAIAAWTEWSAAHPTGD